MFDRVLQNLANAAAAGPKAFQIPLRWIPAVCLGLLFLASPASGATASGAKSTPRESSVISEEQKEIAEMMELLEMMEMLRNMELLSDYDIFSKEKQDEEND